MFKSQIHFFNFDLWKNGFNAKVKPRLFLFVCSCDEQKNSTKWALTARHQQETKTQNFVRIWIVYCLGTLDDSSFYSVTQFSFSIVCQCATWLELNQMQNQLNFAYKLNVIEPKVLLCILSNLCFSVLHFNWCIGFTNFKVSREVSGFKSTSKRIHFIWYRIVVATDFNKSKWHCEHNIAKHRPSPLRLFIKLQMSTFKRS